MSAEVLIVEDEVLVALQLEDILFDAGYQVVGVVSDRGSLKNMAGTPQVALVDLNLRDGATGPMIACQLAEAFGTKIVYVTANPSQLREYAPTAVGIIEKPFSQSAILAAIRLATTGPGPEPWPRDLKPIPRVAAAN
jgi:two-component system, response regulator PdtaR